ncbi:MAG: hypothetical protein K940chlam6_01558, partial [Chlamydiae bacterium]|nr:hypothetical protein [Chlamydiota bacterium]
QSAYCSKENFAEEMHLNLKIGSYSAPPFDNLNFDCTYER